MDLLVVLRRQTASFQGKIENDVAFAQTFAQWGLSYKRGKLWKGIKKPGVSKYGARLYYFFRRILNRRAKKKAKSLSLILALRFTLLGGGNLGAVTIDFETLSDLSEVFNFQI